MILAREPSHHERSCQRLEIHTPKWLCYGQKRSMFVVSGMYAFPIDMSQGMRRESGTDRCRYEC